MKIAGCSKLFGLLAATAMSGVGVGLAEEPVAYEIVDKASIPTSLTGAAGDAAKGREVFIDRKLGNCLGCHQISELATEPFHGEVGPPLDGVADAYEEGEIRLRLVNAKVVNPETIMPGFYVADGLNRVAEEFQGTTILDAEQIEDVIAYLMTLKES